jgi:hypothetical protein
MVESLSDYGYYGPDVNPFKPGDIVDFTLEEHDVNRLGAPMSALVQAALRAYGLECIARYRARVGDGPYTVVRVTQPARSPESVLNASSPWSRIIPPLVEIQPTKDLAPDDEPIVFGCVWFKLVPAPSG